MLPLLPPQLAALRALLDRLIPADEFPGAVEAGVSDYVLRQLSGDCASEAIRLTQGLIQLDAEAAARSGAGLFCSLGPAAQDALLADLEAGRTLTAWPAGIAGPAFFARLVELAHEGFYADPANGGNRGGVSWKMLGYDPRLPRPPSTP